MPRVPILSLGALVALLGVGLALVTLVRAPRSTEAHSLPAGSRKDETLVLTLSSPAWLRSGVGEDMVLVLQREGSRGSQEIWLAAAELHAGGAVVTPVARREGPLGPGDEVAYRWSVRAGSAGMVPMEISVHMQWSATGEGEILWATESRPHVRDYLGMDAVAARVVGMFGCLLGVLTAIIGRKVNAR